MKKAAIEKHGRAFNDDRFVDNKQAYPFESAVELPTCVDVWRTTANQTTPLWRAGTAALAIEERMVEKKGMQAPHNGSVASLRTYQEDDITPKSKG